MLHELYVHHKNFLLQPPFTIAGIALDMVQHGMALGLGGGSTIATLIPLLAEKIKQGFSIQLYTSSEDTHSLMANEGMTIHDQGQAKKLDLYFDGCDQLDRSLNALKSGGGIHTREKILAAMADQFILLADERKWVEKFDRKFPLAVELLPESSQYISFRVEKHYPGSATSFRMKDDKPLRTVHGNFLLNIWFESWPSLQGVNEWLKSLPGVIETSLFYSMATAAIIGGQNGARLIEKRIAG